MGAAGGSRGNWDRKKTAEPRKAASESQPDPYSPMKSRRFRTLNRAEHVGESCVNTGLLAGRSRLFPVVPGTRDRRRTAEKDREDRKTSPSDRLASAGTGPRARTRYGEAATFAGGCTSVVCASISPMHREESSVSRSALTPLGVLRVDRSNRSTEPNLESLLLLVLILRRRKS